MTARTYALGIEYCGTTFNGWQVQPDRPSVQAALEEALSNFADHPVSVICAGRTDAGVHATHQGEMCAGRLPCALLRALAHVRILDQQRSGEVAPPRHNDGLGVPSA